MIPIDYQDLTVLHRSYQCDIYISYYSEGFFLIQNHAKDMKSNKVKLRKMRNALTSRTIEVINSCPNYYMNACKTHLRISLITNAEPLNDIILQTLIFCFVFFCPTQVAPLTHNLHPINICKYGLIHSPEGKKKRDPNSNKVQHQSTRSTGTGSISQLKFDCQEEQAAACRIAYRESSTKYNHLSLCAELLR